jgi:uncharacterized membrane protein
MLVYHISMQKIHTPPSLEELKTRRKPLFNTRHAHTQTLSSAERFAVWMHKHIGSIGFFFFLLAWTVLWLGWNILAPSNLRFDPAPAFVIWLFASNILQLIFLPVIMVGQNIEGRAADWRAQMDFDVNQKAEREIEAILSHLENQNQMLLEIAKRLP